METRRIHHVVAKETDRLRRWRHARHIVFSVWAAILALALGITFVGVTALTVGLWLVDQNPHTNPVTDLGFFALGGIIITSGFAFQLRAPEQKIAGIQQAVIGILALGIGGLVGRRIEPLGSSLLLLMASGLLLALHPARGEFFRIGSRLSPRLAVLSLLAAVPATAYAAAMVMHARQAGPSCFFGRCASGDRFAEMAALALATAAAGLLAASKPAGWRMTAWSVGAAAVIVGSMSLILPEVPGALGRSGGAFAMAWGVLFVAIAEKET